MYQYIHGGDIYSVKKLTGRQEILDFSSNVNPLGLPESVKEAVIRSLDECTNYPDPFCRDLVAALANYEYTDPKYILAANGAAEIIFRLALALKPKKALIFAPTFADYEKALHTVDCSVEYYFLRPEHDFSAHEDLLDQISPGLDLMIICNPNNPTGQLCSRAFLQKVLAKSQEIGAIVMIDECFMDFVEDKEQFSVQNCIEQYKNLVILKAFTKIFAMPGFRLGYALTSNKKLLEQMRSAGQDWSVSTPAQMAGIAALKEAAYLQQTKQLIQTERRFLIDSLLGLGLQVIGSRANYIFFRTQRTDLTEKLIKRGIMVRPCSNYVNLNDEYFRVAVKSREDNLKLSAALRDVICDESSHGHC